MSIFGFGSSIQCMSCVGNESDQSMSWVETGAGDESCNKELHLVWYDWERNCHCGRDEKDNREVLFEVPRIASVSISRRFGGFAGI
jgi:hypothetical protein